MHVNILSRRDSRCICSWLCWSTVPMVRTGRDPAAVSAGRSSCHLAGDSAHRWRYQSANKRSRFAWGIMMLMRLFRRCSRRWLRPASCNAGFSCGFGLRQRAAGSAFPCRSASTSAPSAASGGRPTADSTEQRPPTCGETGGLAGPSVRTIWRSQPCSGSVITHGRRLVSSAPRFRVSQSRRMGC